MLAVTRPVIEFTECLRDSPKFRSELEAQESSIEQLEQRLEKVVKTCGVMVDAGKSFVSQQTAFTTSLWELTGHFTPDDPHVANYMNKMTQSLQEVNKFQSILLDQASCTVIKNLSNFVKNDIKKIKESRNEFGKMSDLLDSALWRNAGANKNKPAEVEEATNLLSATATGFKHFALDHISALTLLQAKKRTEILSTMLSYMQAVSTFFHQGTDLTSDINPALKALGDDLASMRQETARLEKAMQDRHNTSVDDAAMRLPMEGYLFKRTSNAFKTWHRRWFVVQDHQLVYRKRSGDEGVTVMEDMRLCMVRPAADSDRRFCFEVQTPSRLHVLQADSEGACAAWVAALKQAINSALQGPTAARTEAAGSDPIEMRSHRPKLWEQLIALPGNNVCCDCECPEPRWASINLGITLCIYCSGVHRSLGVHYSKVRSLTLDAWEPEILKVMAELGNEVVNQVYTARVPAEAVRASPQCSKSIREAWIKAKYVERKFVADLPTDSGTPTTGQRSPRAAQPKRRWSVRKVRRRPRSKDTRSRSRGSERPETLIENDSTLSTKSQEKPARPATWAPSANRMLADRTAGLNAGLSRGMTDISNVPEEEDLPETASGSSDILLFGAEPIAPLPENSLDLPSDQDSTGGEDDRSLGAEDLDKLEPSLLLYKAAAAHNLPVMCRALALGADKNWVNEADLGRLPIHQAVLSGSAMACEYLLLNGAGLNMVDSEGNTPLHLATILGHFPQVLLLVKHRADHSVRNTEGLTALDSALSSANADIVTLLRLILLNEEMRDPEGPSTGDTTFNDVVRDYTNMASTHPERLINRATYNVDD